VLEVERDQAGVPVVAVDHIRFPGQNRREFQNAAAEQAKPLSAIGIILSAFAVKFVPVERRSMGQQVNWHVGPWQEGLADGTGGGLTGQGNLERSNLRFQFRLVFISPREITFDVAVIGHGQANIMASGPQRLRQRSGHIGQAAGFGKRNNFRRNE